MWQIGRLPPEFGGSACAQQVHHELTPLLDATKPDRGLALAVADGHGGERYDQSHVGSALAVGLALAYCGQILPRFRRGELDNAWLQNELPRRLAQQWKRLVLSRRDAVSGAQPEPDFVARHGSTLLGALIASEGVLVFQIGDGDAVIVTDQNELLRPVPERRPLLGTETESLSQPDAGAVFRVAMLPIPTGRIQLVMLATDGIANSFTEPTGFEKFVLDVLHRTANRAVIGYTPGQLVHRTIARCSSFSGDDVSVALLINTDGSGEETATHE